ncbi:MAG: 50S ribosomal protein L32 [Clostridia bacterium]|nr:50S ribosomal protein L32 [Clostridia bacterium]
MAVPKCKVSKSKGRSRVANWKASAPTLVECPNCHEKTAAHAVCSNCGYYDGEKKTLVKADKKKKETK